jgi:uncharacterized protein YecE (DUF72 family)
MRVLVGTSGYSYREWKGSFYPADISADDMLRYYATRLPAVEINNTFYRLPRGSVLASWAAAVPESFRFAIKASRRITHIRRLKGAHEETGYLLSALETLGERLGVVLYQLPPNLRKDLPRLQEFLELLRGKARSVFEFRHPSWYDDDVYALLRQRRCAVCVSEEDGEEANPPVATAPWGYLRLRRTEYAPGELADWARRIAEQPWEEAYVFFKHEDEATGPLLAERFLSCAP